MRRAVTTVVALTGLFGVLATTAQARPFNDPRSERIPAIEADAAFAAQPPDPACHTSMLASTGGALPAGPSTLAIRWTGFANFELSYKGQIMLLDAYFDRGSLFPPLGFKAADVTRANAILIGHGHHDHMSDAASVGIRTGATIVGAPLTTAKLLSQKVDPQKIRTLSGRESIVMEFGPFKVEGILGAAQDPGGRVRRRAARDGAEADRGTACRARRHPLTRRAGPARRHRRHAGLSHHAR
jgi:hypothetical protein